VARNPNLAFAEAERIELVDPNSRLGRQIRLRGGPYVEQWLNDPERQTHKIIAVPRPGHWSTGGITLTDTSESQTRTTGDVLDEPSIRPGNAIYSFVKGAVDEGLVTREDPVNAHYVDADNYGTISLGTMAHEVKHTERSASVSSEESLKEEGLFYAHDGTDFLRSVNFISARAAKRVGARTKPQFLRRKGRDIADRAAGKATQNYEEKTTGESKAQGPDKIDLMDQLEAFFYRVSRWKRDLKSDKIKPYVDETEIPSNVLRSLEEELNQLQAEVSDDIYKLEMGDLSVSGFKDKMLNDRRQNKKDRYE